MKTSTICLGFLLCIGSVVLPSEEEERQFDLNALLGLLGAGSGSSGLTGLASLLNLPGGNSAALGGLLGTIGGNAGTGGKEGKGGKGKDGKGKGGKGKGKGGDFLSNLLGGKGGKGGKSVFPGLVGRSLKLVESERHGKGKDGKGKDGKGKGKDSAGSSLLDFLSNNLLGQIIQAALNLLTGALGRSDVEPRIDLSSVAPLPNPLTDPLGFITNPMISAIITAMVGGDIPGMLKAQGDLAGYLITQFITNAITG